MARGEQESAGAGRKPLRSLDYVAEAKVDAVRSDARRPHGKIDDAGKAACATLRAGNGPGNAQSALLLADRRNWLGRRGAVVRLDARGKPAEHDRLIAVRERKRAIHKPALAISDSSSVHNAAGIEAPASGRRISPRRARRLCRRKRQRAARSPVGFTGSPWLRTD